MPSRTPARPSDPLFSDRHPSAAARPPIPRSLVIAGNRPSTVVTFESEVVDFFVDAAELLGVPKSLAAIYGIVFASPTPLSFADIETRLDLSKGSISQGLRALREVGAVQEVSHKEDPAELFVPDLEMRRLIGRYLASRLDPQLKGGRDRLSLLETRLASMSPAERKQLAPRLQKLQRWHSRTRALLPLIKAFLKI